MQITAPTLPCVGSNHGSWIITAGFQEPPSRTSALWNQHALRGSKGKDKVGTARQRSREQRAPETSLKTAVELFIPKLEPWHPWEIQCTFARLPAWSQTFFLSRDGWASHPSLVSFFSSQHVFPSLLSGRGRQTSLGTEQSLSEVCRLRQLWKPHWEL